MYVPLSSRDNAANNMGKLFMEAIMDKKLNRMESTDVVVKDMKSELSSMSQLVESHFTFIM